jgi:hypothetical protein
MELFKNIRLKIGQSTLKSRSSSIKRAVKNFDFSKAAQIGILWDATSDSGINVIAAFIKRMTESGKQTEVLAYIPGKDVSDRLTGLTHMRFLRSSDLSFAFIPVSDDAKDFMKKKYDVLIDINPSRIFPLTYIATLSNSLIRVGIDNNSDQENSPYDLMIQTGRVPDIGAFLEQAVHYLSLINSQVNEK